MVRRITPSQARCMMRQAQQKQQQQIRKVNSADQVESRATAG